MKKKQLDWNNTSETTFATPDSAEIEYLVELDLEYSYAKRKIKTTSILSRI